MTADPLTLIHGDCVEVMRSMDEGSVDAIVTDPPYGIGFMGREWDTFSPARLAALLDKRRQRKGTIHTSEAWPTKVSKTSQGGGPSVEYDFSASGAQRFEAWTEAWAREALRVLRPGGHLLSFCGTRMQHRMISGIEDAGFEIRDCLMWLYGSGFPKSLDVSKAIDKAKGAEREVVRLRKDGVGNTDASIHKAEGFAASRDKVFAETAPATELAQKWQGWGTALKPAWEPVILARKPLIGTVAANVEQHGTGALNIDGTRIGTDALSQHGRSDGPNRAMSGRNYAEPAGRSWTGRWPANVLLDEEAAAMLDEQTGELVSGPESDRGHRRNADREAQRNAYGGFQGQQVTGVLYGDRGGASRFFYTAKADKQDRGKGNTHPTVKPVDLMRYLCRLVTPPGGIVLDPFAGSGTTGQAALAEGFRCVLIEREAEYVEGIKQWRAAMQLGLGLSA